MCMFLKSGVVTLSTTFFNLFFYHGCLRTKVFEGNTIHSVIRCFSEFLLMVTWKRFRRVGFVFPVPFLFKTQISLWFRPPAVLSEDCRFRQWMLCIKSESVCMWVQQGLVVIKGLSYTTEQTGHSWPETDSAAVKHLSPLWFSVTLANLRTEKCLNHNIHFLSFASYSNFCHCDKHLLCLEHRMDAGCTCCGLWDTCRGIVTFWRRWNGADTIKGLKPLKATGEGLTLYPES